MKKLIFILLLGITQCSSFLHAAAAAAPQDKTYLEFSEFRKPAGRGMYQLLFRNGDLENYGAFVSWKYRAGYKKTFIDAFYMQDGKRIIKRNEEERRIILSNVAFYLDCEHQNDQRSYIPQNAREEFRRQMPPAWYLFHK